jgi:hypothetical protein
MLRSDAIILLVEAIVNGIILLGDLSVTAVSSLGSVRFWTSETSIKPRDQCAGGVSRIYSLLITQTSALLSIVR